MFVLTTEPRVILIMSYSSSDFIFNPSLRWGYYNGFVSSLRYLVYG